MADITDFVSAPSEEFLDKCAKEQLLKRVEHYDTGIPDKRLKDNIKVILKANLRESGVLALQDEVSAPPVSNLTSAPGLILISYGDWWFDV